MKLPLFLQPAPDSMASMMARSGQNPRLQALNVLWSGWAFLAPVFTHVEPSFWWSLLVGYPIFLALFALVYVRPSAEMGAYVALLVLLAGVSMVWNPSAWTFAVFACVYVPYRGSLLASLSRIALIQLLLVLETIALGWPWWVSLLMVAICSSSGAGALAGRITLSKNTELRLSHDEVRRLAATAERERIGRDLHDLLGHTLSLITLKLELSRKLFDRDAEAARREVAEAENVARHALAQVRAAVTGIRATDLAAELASAQLLLGSSGVWLDHGPPPALPAEIERDLALVLREAVTNIARHAHARRASITFETIDGGVCLTVADNGRGGIDEEGNGLTGIRERVRGLGGRLQIHSQHGHGTRLRVIVPEPGHRRRAVPVAGPDPDQTASAQEARL
ncbi:sensor histidine kinase [Frateuria hangzhouensis]|uniref:sensor histidine kinase n=1 Tax=Frateuria hangzhouensis TaxID=2995589 RepID=UPI002260AEFC|nr:sensor histidine kinase [Frateuria sp. STR12]MCX7513466.1 sensor histidine kinase [Frateuria sp. STR12]